MTDDKRSSLATAPPRVELVVTRSTVPAERNYRNYKPALRKDFWYSCAYCTMCETEGGGMRFTIDHYEPRSERPDLESTYDNLFYACDGCNERKGDRSPPAGARAAGDRFFRNDQDVRSDHFEQKGILLSPKNGSKVADYTIDAVDLNRKELQTLRGLRKRLWECEEAVANGVMALRNFPLDLLPPHIRGNALRMINGVAEIVDECERHVDDLLRDYAMSAILEDGEASQEELQRRKERVARLKAREADHPGIWRGRNK